MFDKYELRSGPSHSTSSITVEEHRAPTDDSVRLYSEMMEKARRNLVEEYIIEDNVVNGVISIFQDHLQGQYIIITRFTLNGKEYQVEAKESAAKFIANRDYGYQKLFEHFSQVLFSTLYKDFRRDF